MAAKILAAKSSIPSAILIRDAIQNMTGKRYLVTSNAEKVNDVLFRYGHSGKVAGNDPALNSVEFINLARDKGKFSVFAKDNGIYSPEFFNLQDDVPLEFPIVIRETLTGFGGAGIHMVQNIIQLEPFAKKAVHWTPYIKTLFELRVHLFIDNAGVTNVSRIYKKVRRDGNAEGDNLVIRNSNEYHFSRRQVEKYPKAVGLCHDLGKKLAGKGGHFIGVDLGYDVEKRAFVVFEINSAPGLSKSNAENYAEFICQELGLEVVHPLNPAEMGEKDDEE